MQGSLGSCSHCPQCRSVIIKEKKKQFGQKRIEEERGTVKQESQIKYQYCYMYINIAYK